MSDLAVLLTGAAVAAVRSYLVEKGKRLAEDVGTRAVDSVARVYSWLRGKLNSAGIQALDDLEAQPQDEDLQAALRVQLRKTLEANASLVAELEQLIQALPKSMQTQTSSQIGSDNRSAQILGDGNAVDMS